MEQNLTRDILQLAVAAPGLPDGVVGWTAESARQALRSLRGTKVAVLAIDVYDRVVWGFAPGNESWVCQWITGELAADFAHRSRSEALEWIDAFPRHNVLFVIEFTGQDAASEATGTTGRFNDAG